MNKFVTRFIAVLVVAGFCWIFPLFHLRSLTQVRAARAGQHFNATDFADRFWNEQLLPSLDRAAEARKVLAAIAGNPQKAQEQFGRSVGISSSYYFFLRGAGRVITAANTLNASFSANDGFWAEALRRFWSR